MLAACSWPAAPSTAGPPEEALGPPAAVSLEACDHANDAAVFWSPRSPRSDQPLRVLAVADHSLEATLVVYAPDGTEAALTHTRRGATPYWWLAEIAVPVAGAYRAALGRGAEVAACRDLQVSTDPHPRPSERQVAWPVERSWDRDAENLYSAWLERLFDDPLDAQPSWHGLGEILRDPARNFLHDHLGLGEDSDGGLRLEPDCADLPFFLRAYFAWKLGLPFGYSECSRGGRSGPPRCGAWHSNLEPPPGAEHGEVSAVERFLRQAVGWTIHSGSARTPAADDRTDLYPTRLSTETIRPGTVYADPYGHTLVVVRRVPQSETAGGILLAVDAQPDGTVARKRYWRGNFLFAVDPSLGGAGFKRFRPIVRDDGRLRALTNREVLGDPAYGDFSLEQYAGGTEGFYDRMDDLLSPTPMDPARALVETIEALDEQLQARVRSVANGEDYVARHPGVIPMPRGAAVFETTGPWEDYATPARDLRVLIAIDVVKGFPERVARRPDRFAMPAGRSPAEVRAELERILGEEAAGRRFAYRRTDGSEWTLTLADILARTEALEVAYNPNDCIEVRWGAPPGSAEGATCRRRAPREQAALMEEYRDWFHERRRPPRA
ncbi:MAG: hypothetical protein E6J70_02460 [Deltaproteobacteria bacterium]|nr:MAG: hypothetical protein E6J70_02460 [Deltaproteobacteria bacterium]